MSSEDLFDIEKQVKHWNERQDQLLEWLKIHYIDHPDWEQNKRDLDVATLKIDQLKKRNTKVGTIPTTYSLPNFKS